MTWTVNGRTGFPPVAGAIAGSTRNMLEMDSFNRVLCRERRRAERSGEFLMLLLLDVTQVEDKAERGQVFGLIAGPVLDGIRETDACGWVKTGELLGIIFTGIAAGAVKQADWTVELKVREPLYKSLAPSLYERIKISVLVFPGERGGKDQGAFNRLFYPEIYRTDTAGLVADMAKRAMDLVGSTAALVLLSPLFLAIALLIKLTSPGPVLFRQTRLGQFGRPFTFLKFRSMYVNNDDSIHREFIRDFLANRVQGPESGSGESVFKIRNDPRITPIGKFLRKTSLDELPQFFNVLRGEMSLVGPRPPIPYEASDYDVWHWYRVLAGKPGITGLWQVRGRSLVTFDGMVRLDIRYIRTWSLWLDIRLLLATPMAVLRGKGAY